jgi:hypothetical protein
MTHTARPFNNWDAVKLVALLLMFIDHSGAFFLREEPYEWLRGIGRGSAPIFMFLAGYAASYRFKWDLFILAALMTVSDTILAGHIRTQNILVTILVTRMILHWWDAKGKVIAHPYQWLIGAFAWVITIILTQYGSLCFMFALCGYVKRRREFYSKQLADRMLVLTFVCFALVSQFTFNFVWTSTIAMLPVLCLVCWMLSAMELRTLDTSRVPAPVIWAGKQLSAYSGYIYALHLIVLEWLTGHPF